MCRQLKDPHSLVHHLIKTSINSQGHLKFTYSGKPSALPRIHHSYLHSHQLQGLFSCSGPKYRFLHSGWNHQCIHIHTSRPPSFKVHHPPSDSFNVLLTHTRLGTTPQKFHFIHTSTSTRGPHPLQTFLSPEATGLSQKFPKYP